MNNIKFFAVGIAAALLIIGSSYITNKIDSIKYNKLQMDYNELKNKPPEFVEGVPDTVTLPGKKIYLKDTVYATVDEPEQIAFADSSYNVNTEDYLSNLYLQYDLKKRAFYIDQNVEVKPKIITKTNTLTKTVTIDHEVEKPRTFLNRFNVSIYAGYGYSIKAKQPDASVGLAFTFALF